MSEYIQVECPEGRSREILQIERGASGEREVLWCSRTLDKPDCKYDCLRKLENVAYLMICDLPVFERSELDSLSFEEILERFEGVPLDRLPVVAEGRLVGSICLRRLAGWKDDLMLSESMPSLRGPDSRCEDREPTDYVDAENDVLQLDDQWLTAVQNLLRTHRNEAFVVDHEGFFVGAVYARQLLRQSVSRLHGL